LADTAMAKMRRYSCEKLKLLWFSFHITESVLYPSEWLISIRMTPQANQEASGIDHERIISHGGLRALSDLSLLSRPGL
jgi:hypothetical protein